MMHEFELIKTFFATQTEHRADVIHGIGDDAAVLRLPKDQELVVTTDTLVAGVHFSEQTSPYDLGYKALAVNLSDLAAMGATPAWVTLAITLPKANEKWLQGFCDGFFTLANRYQVQLIGGDVTHGPLAMTVTALGLLPPQTALLRSQAKSDDLLYVSGTLGDAGLGLAYLKDQLTLPIEAQRFVLERLHRPEPRIELGLALRHHAHAAIDISDGLAADLGHILEESKVGALVYVDQLPLSFALQDNLSPEQAISLALTAGDDYELCFTVAPNQRAALEKTLSSLACRYTCIGHIKKCVGLTLQYQNGNLYHGPVQGYQHF